MSEFKQQFMDLRVDDKDVIIKLFNKILQDTTNSSFKNDKYYEEGISAIGRLILGLVNVERIELKILPPKNEQDKVNKELIN